MYKLSKKIILGLIGCLFCTFAFAQVPNTDSTNGNKTSITSSDVNLENLLNQKVPRKYKIAGIDVTGNLDANGVGIDANLIISVSSLSVGDELSIPGTDAFAKAINRLWSQEYFNNVVIYITKVVGDQIWLEIHLEPRPKLSRFYLKGIPKGQADEIKGRTGLVPGRAITENKKLNAERAIRNYYEEKGFRNIQINTKESRDTVNGNMEMLTFNIDRGIKVKVADVHFYGDSLFSESLLRSKLKGVSVMSRITLHPATDPYYWGAPPKYTFKDYIRDRGPLDYQNTKKYISPYFRLNPFASAKFDQKKYTDAKENVINYYNSKGYRDAQILKDTIYHNSQGHMVLALKVQEGHKYYFGNITWRGNTKYSDSILNVILGVQKGDIYDADILNKKLGKTMDPEIADISSLYLDEGYLFFQANPIETVYNDTIDFEIRIREGAQATIKRQPISGNDKTNEHVIRRELRSYPGDLFSRSALIRSQRQLMNLGYLNQEKINPQPVPNEEDGTVDINWDLEEKSSDQLELSAGFGGGIGLTGTLGLTFSNFSTSNLFSKNAWDPLPTGDGQKVSLRFQSNGRAYRSYNVSFTEPWLGGKKPNALTVSFVDTKYSNGYDYYTRRYTSAADTTWFRTTGVSLGYSKMLRWPDDYFSFGASLNYTRYTLHNYYIDYYNLPNFRNGNSNNLNLKLTLNRYSIDNPVFPRSGSNYMLSAQLTPPYTLLDKSLVAKSDQYKWIEYHKWRFTGEWYVPLTAPIGSDKKQLVLKMSAKYGYIGKYNKDSRVKISPFERFQVGDAGLSNTYSFLGYDIISQRGYPVYDVSDPSVNPDKQTANQYFTIFNKYTTELRFPISLSPSSTIFALGFFEAANGWDNFKSYNPFKLRRSVGLGMRFNLPMFGLLGFDYGIGLDRTQPGQGIKGAGRFTFMLGFEPD